MLKTILSWLGLWDNQLILLGFLPGFGDNRY